MAGQQHGLDRVDHLAGVRAVEIEHSDVGPRAGVDGYADFCGGSGHGFKEAPAIARELADWLVEGKVRADFRQFSYDRVAANNLFVLSYGGNRG